MEALVLLLFAVKMQVVAATLFSPCSNDNDCGWNQKCRFKLCVCRPGFVLQDPPVDCIEAPKLGENCSSSMFCATPLAFCYNDTCVCSYPYEPVDGRCIHPAKTLGQQCRSHAECVVAYSHCAKGVCKCKPGFQGDKDACLPYEYNCNTGPTPLVDGMVIPCKLNFTSSVDDCPETLFCVMLSEPVDSKQLVDGICCNQTTSYYGNYGQCPVGFNEGMENCNARTAASFPFYDVVSGQFLCCPLPCLRKSRLHEHRCYDSILEVGDVCSFSAECPIGTICVANRCICQPGYTAVDGDCYLPQCFSGVPLRDVNTGELVQCTSQSPCPSGFYCIDEFRMCCSDLDLTN
ncbi:hypothetical protein M514_03071 [Trichuris suis]|uniref:EGF-like domain-containing protein n=1 Tax=Trichuris suis TaxID=68888 RepID=A0A085NFQ0_9BILA|nr:hypothetical protein M514_03071 [Trichuris suis]